MCKNWLKNSHPFGKQYQKTAGGRGVTHAVDIMSHLVELFTFLQIFSELDDQCQCRCRTGMTMVNQPSSGCRVSSSHKHSSLASCRTTPANTPFPSITSVSTSRYYIQATLVFWLQMCLFNKLCMSLSRQCNGFSHRRLHRKLTQRFSEV